MEQTFSYKLFERLVWSLVAAGIGIFLLVIGVGYTLPQERPAAAVSWLEVLTGSAVQQPTFFTPLSQVILVIFGIMSLIFAVLMYRASSTIIRIDEEAITSQRGGKIQRIPWSEVVDVKKRVIVRRYGAVEIVTIATQTDPQKITFNATIKGYPELVKVIQERTKIEF